jgi:predicted metallopeptidase
VHGVKSKWGTEKARKMHIKKIRSAEGSECQENNSNLSTKAQVEISPHTLLHFSFTFSWCGLRQKDVPCQHAKPKQKDTEI